LTNVVLITSVKLDGSSLLMLSGDDDRPSELVTEEYQAMDEPPLPNGGRAPISATRKPVKPGFRDPEVGQFP
jgi:hypothetical protein